MGPTKIYRHGNERAHGVKPAATFQAEVGERLREARLRLGISKEEVARRARASVSEIDDLESGQWVCGDEKIWDVGSALNLSAHWLVFGLGEEYLHPAKASQPLQT